MGTSSNASTSKLDDRRRQGEPRSKIVAGGAAYPGVRYTLYLGIRVILEAGP